MKKYRLSKYNPMYRDVNGDYLLPEWTSCYDINKYYNSRVLTVDEYLFVEQKYINTISTILEYYSCNSFIINNLERGLEVNELYPIFGKIGIKLEENEITFLESLAEDVVVYSILILDSKCNWKGYTNLL